MFRLIKLAAYALFGIAAYELIMGIMEGQTTGQLQRAQRRSGAPRRSSSSGSGSRPGGNVSVEGADGASHRQRVGRGAVSR